MMDILVNDKTASIKLLSKPGLISATIVSLRIIMFLTLNIKVKTFYKYLMNKSFSGERGKRSN